MKEFYLVPRRILDNISDCLSMNFDKWRAGWAPSNTSPMSISAFNVFDKAIYKSDEYYRYKLDVGDIYVSGKHSMEPLFGEFIFNKNVSDVDDIKNNSENKLMQNLIVKSISDYFIYVLSCESVVENDLITSEELFKKGSGNVVITFLHDELEANIIFTPEVYKNIVQKKTYLRQSEKFNNLEIHKLKNKINVSVVLNKTKLNIKDLLELSKGDCLVLDHKTTTPLNLMNNDNLITKCHVGSNDNYKSINIIN